MSDLTGVWGLFASAFVSATLAPGGSEVVLAYLVRAGQSSPGLLLGVATAGNTLGALSTWLLGRWTRHRYPLTDLEQPGKVRALRLLRRYGSPVLLLSWLPVVGDAFCFAAGWLRVGIGVSTAMIAIGKALRYAAVVALAIPG